MANRIYSNWKVQKQQKLLFGSAAKSSKQLARFKVELSTGRLLCIALKDMISYFPIVRVQKIRINSHLVIETLIGGKNTNLNKV